ncbi:holo-ACP synthase [Shewanella algae]|jgi:holo-[acyl-carrier protein] synthase|uniref:holo-ACP synthase n=1 Tax=Shewanella algae TaxID=38313 RepID=UPI0008DC713A|nr:holo-ACP synthase [Shewanella algae]EKT4489091.1 holo-ACP synthase [Shewanella algae]MBC8794400.1 holo-ACP synthase [Shewanella algae]MBO2548851.1 holo-ACP synthase [Shewanella algae]MBO2561985.1 holo-ACP synthase [Shewanella algae]MBO2587641.1 holo-ACP synthase [Shewanella algae]
MAVLGLGTDIVEIARIEAQLERGGDRLAKRVLTEAEYARFQTLSEPARFLAKRFAAKEAAAKALGTGIGRGVSFQHIHISNNADGAPQLEFSDGARQRLETLGAKRALLSIADERHYAVATVILSD